MAEVAGQTAQIAGAIAAEITQRYGAPKSQARRGKAAQARRRHRRAQPTSSIRWSRSLPPACQSQATGVRFERPETLVREWRARPSAPCLLLLEKVPPACAACVRGRTRGAHPLPGHREPTLARLARPLSSTARGRGRVREGSFACKRKRVALAGGARGRGTVLAVESGHRQCGRGVSTSGLDRRMRGKHECDLKGLPGQARRDRSQQMATATAHKPASAGGLVVSFITTLSSRFVCAQRLVFPSSARFSSSPAVDSTGLVSLSQSSSSVDLRVDLRRQLPPSPSWLTPPPRSTRAMRSTRPWATSRSTRPSRPSMSPPSPSPTRTTTRTGSPTCSSASPRSRVSRPRRTRSRSVPS